MKKIPLRRCIGCMQSKSKKELYRIVKLSENSACFDKTGKMSGRGTYICSIECLNKAIKTKKIDRELNVSLDNATCEQLLIDINTNIN